jgi:pimeloyl-ACP methyl ester carboxylesterase
MHLDARIGRNFLRLAVERCLLICHGLPYESGSVVEKNYSKLANFFALKGIPSAIFDFSGTGLSEGRFRLSAWIEDLVNIAEKFDRVYLLGYSMGGVIAIRVAAELKNVVRIATVSTPCSADMFSRDVLRFVYENARTKGVLRGIGDFETFSERFEREFFEIEPLRWIRRIRIPKLIVHGTEDEIVPYTHGQRLFEAAIKPKTFVKVRNGSHFLRQEDTVSEIIADWMRGKIEEEFMEIKI